MYFNNAPHFVTPVAGTRVDYVCVVDQIGMPEKIATGAAKPTTNLRDTAYAIVGEPDPVQFEDRVVGIIEARDGTIMDVVRQVKRS